MIIQINFCIIQTIENESCRCNKNATTSLPNSKQQYFSADNNNIPFENDRYPDLSIVLAEEFRPNINICATLLWSHPQTMSFISHTSWLKPQHFPFSIPSIKGSILLFGTKMKVCTLIDPGASNPMVNKNLYGITPFLQAFSSYRINTKPLKIANNNIINMSEFIKIVISFLVIILKLLHFW